ncbi:MAG: hypothetical protein JOZ47_19055 [Kutzneria sp.]|nr:hypothetical protein [Kutzneria sp.]
MRVRSAGMLVLSLLGVLVVLGPTSTAVVDSDPAPPVRASPEQDGRTTAVTDLLHRRADAILRHDRAGFLATVDPAATAQFAAAQRALFDNLAGVPLATWSYRVDPSTVLSPLGGQARDDVELWAPAVELAYTLDGIDGAPATEPMGYLFAKRGDRWYLTSDTGLSRQTWRGPWDFGSVTTLRAASGLVLTHPRNLALGRRVAAELDDDVAAVTAVWGRQWPQRVAVLLPDSTDELRAFVGAEFAVQTIAAVAVADSVDHDNRSATGQRVVLNPNNARKLSAASLRVVLRHELTHVAARGVTVDGTPMWMLEGFADYVGYYGSGIAATTVAPEVARLIDAGTPPRSLPANSDFAASGGRIELAYQEAWTVTSYIAETFGQDALVRLYQAVAGEDPSASVDKALVSVIGVDQAELVRGWQKYLTQWL